MISPSRSARFSVSDRYVRRRSLGTEATYRVLAQRGDMLEVEVVDAPGLQAGQRFKFSHGALASMELMGASSPSAGRLKSALPAF